MFTQYFLQEELAKEIKKIFKGSAFYSPASGDYTGLNVYMQDIPVQKQDGHEETDDELYTGMSDDTALEEPFPYIIVRMDGGKAENPLPISITVDAFLLIGIYDSGDGRQGHKDVCNIIQKIYERFAKKDTFSAFRVSKMEWIFQEEPSYPYYFGAVELELQALKIQKEDRFT